MIESHVRDPETVSDVDEQFDGDPVSRLICLRAKERYELEI